jgi:molybdopterin converting factor small subunit
VVTVKVIMMGELLRLTGQREWEVELAQESTVQTLLEKLSDLCGEAFAQRALTREGTPHPHLALFVNGVDIQTLAGTQTVLPGGQVELLLLSMFAGGT